MLRWVGRLRAPLVMTFARVVLLIALAATGLASASEPSEVEVAFDVLELDCEQSAALCEAALRVSTPGGSRADMATLMAHVAGGHALYSLVHVMAPGSELAMGGCSEGYRVTYEISLLSAANGGFDMQVGWELDQGGDISQGSTSLWTRPGDGPFIVGQSSRKESGPGGSSDRMTLVLVELGEPGSRGAPARQASLGGVAAGPS